MSYLEAATKTTNSNPDKNHYSPHKKKTIVPLSCFFEENNKNNCNNWDEL